MRFLNLAPFCCFLVPANRGVPAALRRKHPARSRRNRQPTPPTSQGHGKGGEIQDEADFTWISRSDSYHKQTFP